jgi:anaerobic selenocysteine-containing dehydrogenase
MTALVTEEVHPECAVMPAGFPEANPNRLISADLRDPISGFPAFRSGICRIEKA